MNIGEKIRELRLAKLMTQAELAGSQITRNMLSCIENGTANPSLSTILYIAGRLNVPAGFLLAEEGDEVVYRKMTGFANIKRAYVAGDFIGCRSLCFSACPEPDDEIRLLLANCDLRIAEEEFWHGRLRSACRFFDEALSYADTTFYPTDAIEARAQVFFRYMRRISPTLYSDMLDEEKQITLTYTSPFATYTDALEGLDRDDAEVAQEALHKLDGDSFFAHHLRILLWMREGDFTDSRSDLLALLNSEKPLSEIELYTVLCDLEVCCRETEDYKGAYNYASEKVQILEQLLKEV